MSTALKALYLTVHVALSALVALLVWAGFEMADHRDGSSTTPGGLVTGFLTLLAWGIMVVPLIVAVAAKWVSRWWLIPHWLLGGASLVLTVYAMMFEEVGSSDLG
ncbi:hypothetical protein GCM10023085_80920 [Actinomadura viridis]|uniref:Zn-dependent protease with chaperone function n=1 Tax=Actinomadura viridis TaxID=58110 RepID=A0A931DQU2_9ACTN|nr:hypothetical protein [Actinomadura viridis]MBG6092116.1 Zn-dependent protease with chaperone function [Actinomadura viridis]